MSRSRFGAAAALAAIALGGLGAALVFAGTRVALAAIGSARLEDRLAPVLDLTDDPIPDFAPLLVERRRWVTTPGARAEARQDLVMMAALVEETAETPFEDTLDRSLIELFKIEPAAPGYWAVLADLRADLGEDPEAVRSAFRMSTLVERLEAPAMSQRVETGFRAWESLGDEEREIVVNDLVTLRPRLGKEQLEGLAELAAELGDAERAEIHAAIAARLGEDAWIESLGL